VGLWDGKPLPRHAAVGRAAPARHVKRRADSLTIAQRFADEFASRPDHRSLLKGRLVSNMELALRVASHARSGAEQCANLVRRLAGAVDETQTA